MYGNIADKLPDTLLIESALLLSKKCIAGTFVSELYVVVVFVADPPKDIVLFPALLAQLQVYVVAVVVVRVIVLTETVLPDAL